MKKKAIWKNYLKANRNLSDAYHKRKITVLRLTKDSLTGSDILKPGSHAREPHVWQSPILIEYGQPLFI